jgi:hypothetical protein
LESSKIYLGDQELKHIKNSEKMLILASEKYDIEAAV